MHIAIDTGGAADILLHGHCNSPEGADHSLVWTMSERSQLLFDTSFRSERGR